jgi:tetratricopeptide (TPR) repeat protein
MKDLSNNNWKAFPLIAAAASMLLPSIVGCGPNYREMRHDGQTAMLDGAYGSACVLFKQAAERKPRDVDNLYDLGTCSMMQARENFREINHAAAMRDVDAAIAYYGAAIDVRPGHQASLEGKNTALELKGQFDEALQHAEWVAEFVGPSAKQYVYLAREHEERGDDDSALLRYRQAVAVETDSPLAHRAIAKFLLRNNNEPAAVHHLQAAYRLDPKDKWVFDELVARGAVPPLASRVQETP